jgi:5'-nucleotidase
MRSADYSILGANIRFADGTDVPWIPNDTIVHRGPFAIGIIGISTVQTPVTTIPANVADLRFVDPVAVVDSIAPALRARGADFVIILAHAGGSCIPAGCQGEILDLAHHMTAKVDAIVSGHSHTLLDTDVRGIPIVQARSRGQAVDVVDLQPGARFRAAIREVYTDSVAPDSETLQLVRESMERLDSIAPVVNAPVAQIQSLIPNRGSPNPLANLISDAMRVVGRGDVAVMNSGGIRQSIPAGTATYGRLFEVQPFGNRLMRVRVRGSDLRAYFAKGLAQGRPNFHVSGTRIVYHQTPPAGIDSISVMGAPLDDNTVYTVVINDFMFGGGDKLGFGPAALSSESADVSDLDALIAYLESLPQPVTAPMDQRLIIRR